MLLASRCFDREIDDVYIDLLFGRNLVEHGKFALDWNGPRIEGFSSPLNILLHALVYALGIEDALVLAKLRALLCAGLTIVATYCLLRRLTRTRALPWLGAGLLALSPAFQYWAVAGLETPMYALWLVLSVELLTRPRLSLGSAVPLGLLAVTRPEGPLLTALGALFVAIRLWRGSFETRPDGRSVLAWLALLTATALPYHAFRWGYFQVLFPNTYYAKVNDYVEPWYGVRYLAEFVRQQAPWLALGLPLALVPGRGRGGASGLAALFLLAQVLVAVRAGGDWMPQFRFAAQVLPLCTVVALCGVENVLDSWRSRQQAGADRNLGARLGAGLGARLGILRAGRWLLAAAMGASIIFLGRRASVHAADWSPVPDFAIVASAGDYRELAGLLREACAERGLAPQVAVVALEPVGIVPYFSGLRVLDLSGKTHREIGSAAQRFGQLRVIEQELWVADLVFAQRPDFFCKSGGMYPGHQTAVTADPRFDVWYEKRAQVGDWIELYARRAQPIQGGPVRIFNRVDGRNLLAEHSGEFEAVADELLAERVRAAWDRGAEVRLYMELNAPIRPVEPLLALGRLTLSERSPRRVALALEPGTQSREELVPGLPLSSAEELRTRFAPSDLPWTLASAAPSHLRLECLGEGDWNLLSLIPLDVRAYSMCLIEASIRLERKQGLGSGLHWSVYTATPNPEAMLDHGQVLLYDVQDGWSRVGVAVPLAPEGIYLSVGVGGVHNRGSVLLVRDLRIVALAR